MNVNTEIEVLKTSNSSIKEYVDSGIELLANLDLLFLESDYEGKRILVGSIFTKKLLFGNDGCRTTDVNEVLGVLTRNSNGFERAKKEKAVISDSFSASVPPSRPNMNEILEDTKDFARIWDLYGHLLKKD